MPVPDTNSHPSTIRTIEPYGCFNRPPMKEDYTAIVLNDDSLLGSIYKKTWIQHRMSTKCRQYGLWDSDPRCKGCNSEKDVEYAEIAKSWL